MEVRVKSGPDLESQYDLVLNYRGNPYFYNGPSQKIQLQVPLTYEWMFKIHTSYCSLGQSLAVMTVYAFKARLVVTVRGSTRECNC